MPRPHIEFIQAQVLPWRPGTPETKTLSEDPETGEATSLRRYPAGWHWPEEVLARDEEFFVLDGQLEIGSLRYGRDCYGFHPAGWRRGAVASRDGAVVLTFIGSAVPYDPRRLIERVDVREGAWRADLDAMGLTVMAADARIRVLRNDPASGEMTYITATIAYWRETQPERHPVVQEIFQLAGEVAGPCGLMRQGGYIWRPPHMLHGPYGSTTGAVFLFRSRGGPLTTEHEQSVPFSFDPPHRPVLPPELRGLGAEPWVGGARY